MTDEKELQAPQRGYYVNVSTMSMHLKLKKTERGTLYSYTHNGTRATFFIENIDPKNDNGQKYHA